MPMTENRTGEVPGREFFEVPVVTNGLPAVMNGVAEIDPGSAAEASAAAVLRNLRLFVCMTLLILSTM
jgi:hypothetical protein